MIPPDYISTLSSSPELNDTIQQVAKWLANAYHVAIFDHRDWTTVVLILVGAFCPKLPFQIIKFPLWTIPKSLFVAIVRCLGFGEKGVQGNSYASRYQSEHYGGYIEPDGLFSHYQAVGARGYREVNDESEDWGFLRFVFFLAAFLTWAGYMPDSV